MPRISQDESRKSRSVGQAGASPQSVRAGSLEHLLTSVSLTAANYEYQPPLSYSNADIYIRQVVIDRAPHFSGRNDSR